MGTNTPFLQLFKPAGTDFVNEATDLNANWDKVDTFASGTDTVVDTHEADIAAIKTALFGSTGRTVAPAAKISKTGTQSVADVTTVTVTYAQTDYETDASFGDHTNNQLVTPIAGLYLVTAQFTYTNAFTGIARFKVINGSNGNQLLECKWDAAGSGTGEGGALGLICGVLNLASGFSIKTEAWHNKGSSETLDNIRAGTFLAAKWIGPPP